VSLLINLKIYSNPADFDSDDDLKIDSDLDSNNSKDENSSSISSNNIIYPIYSYLFNKNKLSYTLPGEITRRVLLA